MLTEMKQWLQGYMDAYWSGTVNTLVFDGIAGNCTLLPCKTKIISQSRTVQGNLYECTQCRFPIRYLTDAPSAWMEELGIWCRERTRQREGPVMQGQTASVWLEDQSCKPNADGTWEYFANVVAEFTLCFEEVSL